MRGGWIGLVVCVALAGCSAGGSVEGEADGAPLLWASVGPMDCSEAADAVPEVRASRPVTYWADDAGLRAALVRVLTRLNAATGLGLSLARGGVEVSYSDLPPDTSGFALGDIEIDVAVAAESLDGVLLHELGHILGARHLGPLEGVMSRCVGVQTQRLTEADLVLICAAAPCAAFQPEPQ